MVASEDEAKLLGSLPFFSKNENVCNDSYCSIYVSSPGSPKDITILYNPSSPYTSAHSASIMGACSLYIFSNSFQNSGHFCLPLTVHTCLNSVHILIISTKYLQ
ncbi:hypothetical protein POVWA2_067060 [Plasmodium ovale wallikeri]|uniref:Uncharacterized protein n=1 Tax=Plasmodium ovale wallikeri TaxID=864142 RepID=A0A1A9AFE5_PLAOA|nr:hypothetical protein POVWA1_067640 [Plasmodium ovale wallikeri]SBT55256.1 hypothetical protein POVWA2_067060 [Plasmodium ovale wallikeri]